MIAEFLIGDRWVEFARSEAIEDELSAPLLSLADDTVIRVSTNDGFVESTRIVRDGEITLCRSIDRKGHEINHNWHRWWNSYQDPVDRILLVCRTIRNRQQIVETMYAVIKDWLSIIDLCMIDAETHRLTQQLSLKMADDAYSPYATLMREDASYRTNIHYVILHYLQLLLFETTSAYILCERIIQNIIGYHSHDKMIEPRINKMIKEHITLTDLLRAAAQ